MLKTLYTKFTSHYPDYRFGYNHVPLNDPLFTRISVQDKRSGRAKLDNIALDATEQEIKLAWYTLLKELGHANQTS